MKAKRTGRGRASTWQLLVIALPGILYLIINNYIPMFGVFLAFKDYNYFQGIFGSDWCGFENFEFLFRSTEQIKKDHPELPAFESYDELLAAIRKVM